MVADGWRGCVSVCDLMMTSSIVRVHLLGGNDG